MQKLFKPSSYFNYNDLFQDIYQSWSDEWEEWGGLEQGTGLLRES